MKIIIFIEKGYTPYTLHPETSSITFERLANLVAHSEGIAIDGEVGIYLHFYESDPSTR